MRRLTLGAACMQHPTFDEKEVLPDTPEPFLEEAMGLVREAAGRGCDILCLPEHFADPSRSVHAERWAETPGGPITSWLSRAAQTHRMALVTTVALRDGRRVTNSGVFYDKQGRLVGCYPKVHLPGGEREKVEAGTGFPVFNLEGARVGMQTCYDLEYPEGCRILALKGAEIIFWPNMWGGMPEEHTEVMMKARAIENMVFLVSSAYVLAGDGFFRVPKIHGRGCVIDWSGAVLAEVGRRLGVAAATVDVDEVHNNPLRCRATHFGRRLPHLYAELADPRLRGA
jgi:predicted amidohydrolase